MSSSRFPAEVTFKYQQIISWKKFPCGCLFCGTRPASVPYHYRMVLVNPLSASPTNGQTHSNNSLETADELFECDHFVGLVL